jgi:hypothetical protein
MFTAEELWKEPLLFHPVPGASKLSPVSLRHLGRLNLQGRAKGS